eukprot:Rhum_TRINITY_DN19141_c0_g1::Rhum_TRINITY_DN19141_c0_g1_i1::g.169277::m.169277
MPSEVGKAAGKAVRKMVGQTTSTATSKLVSQIERDVAPAPVREGLKSVRKEAQRELKLSPIAQSLDGQRKMEEKVERPVRPLPKLPLSPSFIDKLKYHYNFWMHVFEKNDRRVKKGELNQMFSIKWIYAYGLAALGLHVLYLLTSGQILWKQSKITPLLDQRRKDFDPFEQDGENCKKYAVMTEEEEVTVSAKELRTDSSFRAA